MSATPAPAIVRYAEALAVDCAAKTWWNTPAVHPSIARALQIDPKAPGAVYAMTPFRYAKLNGAHLIIVAWPAPKVFTDPTPDWLEIEAVIAWDPVENTAWTLQGAFDIPDNPRAVFQKWAAARAKFAAKVHVAHRKGIKLPAEADLMPGYAA